MVIELAKLQRRRPTILDGDPQKLDGDPSVCESPSISLMSLGLVVFDLDDTLWSPGEVPYTTYTVPFLHDIIYISLP